jgi:hypothetical protein
MLNDPDQGLTVSMKNPLKAKVNPGAKVQKGAMLYNTKTISCMRRLR